MTDHKTDQGAARVAQENYLTGFKQNGDPNYALVWTSTCSTAPARLRIYSETEWTKEFLYPSMAATFESLQDTHPEYTYEQRLHYVGDLYGRSRTTVWKAIKSEPEST
jgi:hypothetical protein